MHSSLSTIDLVLVVDWLASCAALSDDRSVSCVLAGVSVLGESIVTGGDSSASWSESEKDMSARRLVLFLLSALLLARMGSPSSSRDLFELELRCEEVTDGLRARYLSPS